MSLQTAPIPHTHPHTHPLPHSPHTSHIHSPKQSCFIAVLTQSEHEVVAEGTIQLSNVLQFQQLFINEVAHDVSFHLDQTLLGGYTCQRWLTEHLCVMYVGVDAYAFVCMHVCGFVCVCLCVCVCVCMCVRNCILNKIGGSENLSCSLFSAVPIDIAAILSFCKRSRIVANSYVMRHQFRI